MTESFGLPERMKRYEAVTDTTLTRRTPVIIRVDGKAFHTLTRGMARPFDKKFAKCMTETAMALVSKIQGAKLAYSQSDEVSVLLSDFDTIQTDAWLGYRVQKMVSIAASIATAAFTEEFRFYFPDRVEAMPLFDARAFSLPHDEVVNYFVWRQRDAVRNSILATAQHRFSHSEMQGISCERLQARLYTEHGVNWNDTETRFKRGFCALPDGDVDWEIPTFTQDREYIERRLAVRDLEAV